MLTATLAILPQGAWAAEDEAMRRLIERLDRLEGQLINGQSRVDARAATPAAIAKPGEPLAPTAAARFELRVSQMETEVRRLTGHVEELNFTIQKTRERLDTLVSDVDQRLTALGRRRAQGHTSEDGRHATTGTIGSGLRRTARCECGPGRGRGAARVPARCTGRGAIPPRALVLGAGRL